MDIRAQKPGSDRKLKGFCNISITQIATAHNFISTTQFQQYGPKLHLDHVTFLTAKQFHRSYHKVIGLNSSKNYNNAEIFNNNNTETHLPFLYLVELKFKIFIETTVKKRNGLSSVVALCFQSTEISTWYPYGPMGSAV